MTVQQPYMHRMKPPALAGKDGIVTSICFPKGEYTDQHASPMTAVFEWLVSTNISYHHLDHDRMLMLHSTMVAFILQTP